MAPPELLSFNAAAQIAFSSLLGWAMLVPMQPWGARFAPRAALRPALRSAHLDWLMLAFMQFGAAYLLDRWPVTHAPAVAALLVFGGWLNPVPYVMRGFGVDAFSFSGGWKQKLSAGLSGISSLAITAAWLLVLAERLAG
ncbi:MAG: hypothetical protein IPJ65_12665 [Archangiaceae bacterium]|nr:hypothetical protein [Archangiaceae bacterium]